MPLSVCALDCEMCQTERGLALTRLTVISESQSVVLDALVVPPEEITDYITQYSGVTPELLRIASRENGIAVNRDGTMVLSMRQAQIAFLRLVSRETVIVGHSLDSDLTALQIVHERVVDTAYLYPHPRGFPLRKKLRSLAKEFLGLDIQTAGASGHDSCEDARASLQLTLHLLQRDHGVTPGFRTRTDLEKQEYYNYEHFGRKALSDPKGSILPSVKETEAGYPVESCLCYDLGSWSESAASSNGNSIVEKSKVDSSGNNNLCRDAYGMYSIGPCLGPSSELFTGNNTDQTLARAVSWWQRRNTNHCHIPDQSQITSPPLSFCYTSLNFGGVQSARNALLAIESALSAYDAERGHRAGYIIILIAQPALHPLYKLRHQKKVVLNSGGASAVPWGEGFEARMKQAGDVANAAQITFINSTNE